MSEIVSLDRHPILMQAYEVCQAIEECGCSEELTAAVIKASDLLDALKPIVVEIEQLTKIADQAGVLQVTVELEGTGCNNFTYQYDNLCRLLRERPHD